MLALMVITGIYDYVRLSRDRDRLVAETREELRIFAETLALAVSRNVRRGQTSDELKELLDDILARPGLLAVAIYDPAGRLVAQTVAAGAAPPRADDALRSALATRQRTSSVVEGPDRLLRHVEPFRWPGGRTAALEVRESLAQTERQFWRDMKGKVIARLSTLAAFVLSILAVTRWSIARPIRALIRGARAVGHGDLAQRIELRRRDEIGQLAEEFNRMAANLQAAHAEILRQAEERRRLEQDVEQAQKMTALGMLVAEIAHEIGTPLNVISGRAEVLGRTLPPDHPDRHHVELILGQTERITGIIRSLLDYSRPRRPELREEAIAAIIARVADLVLGRCRAKDVRIRLDLRIGLPPVRGDADQLQQLFLNLVLNALDASPRGSQIHITEGDEPVLPDSDRTSITRGKVEGPFLAIHVVDAGEGIDASQLDHVFQPFFSTKKRGEGTGLGLAIAEEIVRAHRGEVEVLSIRGRGTEVVVRLPISPPWSEELAGAPLPRESADLVASAVPGPAPGARA
jgi:signal transduction histidine kinase